MKNKVTVLGTGAWGTAFATLLAENGHEVIMWSYEQEVADEITQYHCNKQYLEGVTLDAKITATCDMQEALTDTTLIFGVVPVKFLRKTFSDAKPYIRDDQVWILLSKGIEQDTLKLPSTIFEEICGESAKVAVLSGPSFAGDLAEKQYTSATIATSDHDLGCMIQKALANNYFHPFLSDDMIGVQVGGALKNVLALTVGIARGAGFKDNTVAFLLTRGLREIVRVATHFGGKEETVYGLSGLGDLVLTSMGSLGRNLKVGEMIGQGQALDQILKTTGLMPEGINTVQSVHEMITKEKLDLPICQGTYDIIFKQSTMKQLLDDLIARPLSQECV